MLLSVRAVARASVELAKAEVTVGNEWAHAEIGGQGESLPVAVFSLPDIEGIAMQADLAEEADRMSQDPALASSALWAASSVRPAKRYVSLSDVSNSDW